MINIDQLPNRLPEEKTKLVVRRHWWIPTKIIVALFFSGLIPIGAYFFINTEYPILLSHPIAAPLLTLFTSFYYLILWVLVFQEVIDFYLDTWIVTTERVIDVEQFGLFRRETTECHLASIVDVTSEMKGVIQTLLRYGNVTVQTAGERGQLVFREVPNPDSVRQLVLGLMQEDRARHERVATATPAS